MVDNTSAASRLIIALAYIHIQSIIHQHIFIALNTRIHYCIIFMIFVHLYSCRAYSATPIGSPHHQSFNRNQSKMDWSGYNTDPMHFRVSGFILYGYRRIYLLYSVDFILHNTTRCTSAGLVDSSLNGYQRIYLLYSVDSSSKYYPMHCRANGLIL